jgi:hypothetical protein
MPCSALRAPAIKPFTASDLAGMKVSYVSGTAAAAQHNADQVGLTSSKWYVAPRRR